MSEAFNSGENPSKSFAQSTENECAKFAQTHSAQSTSGAIGKGLRKRVAQTLF
jgi:hypothetical protein